MGTTAVFIVPNNQSQEFIVTQCDDDGYPSYVYSLLSNYDTEVKARKLCKMPSFKKLEAQVDEIEPSEEVIKARSTRFSYGYGGLRILLRKPEFCGRDYYYLFSKGRWLWADDFNKLIDFVKDGSLTMCDEMIDDIESDIMQYVGNPLKLDQESDEFSLYKKIVSGKGFIDFFHRLITEYEDYFNSSNLCYFYKHWIVSNEKGVSEIVRSNLVRALKRKGQLIKIKESSIMRENVSLDLDDITDEQLLKMSDEEFDNIFKSQITFEVNGTIYDYQMMKDVLDYFKKTCILLARQSMKDSEIECEYDLLEDRLEKEIMDKLKQKLGWTGDLNTLYDLFDRFDEEPPTIIGIISQVEDNLFRNVK